MDMVRTSPAPSRRQFAASLFAASLGANPATALASDGSKVEALPARWTTPEAYGCIGDGIASDQPSFQRAVDALRPGQTLLCNGNYRLSSGLRLIEKVGIRITGKGRLFLDAAHSSSIIFELVGNVSDLEIDSLTLEGGGLASGKQSGIACFSGQIVSNTHFHGLKIRNLNVGISHNADLGGAWTGSRVHNNMLTNICGTAAGSGYGIHAARSTKLHIYNNDIDNCSRHSIYLAKGYSLEAVIEGNKISNHRKDVFEGTYRAAISCSRVSGVIIANNIIMDGYDGYLEIAHETSSRTQCYDVLVTGNRFINRKNAVPYVVIGEPAAPTLFRTSAISFRNNKFHDDASITTATVVNLLNGNRIFVENNDLYVVNATNALPIFVELGNSRVTPNEEDVSEITVRNNRGYANATVRKAFFLYISKRLCSGRPRYRAVNNAAPNWGDLNRFECPVGSFKIG
jgi:hypothetical protein